MKLAYTAHQNAYLSIKLANPYSQHKPNSLEKAQPLAAWRSLAENLYALAEIFGWNHGQCPAAFCCDQNIGEVDRWTLVTSSATVLP